MMCMHTLITVIYSDSQVQETLKSHVQSDASDLNYIFILSPRMC